MACSLITRILAALSMLALPVFGQSYTKIGDGCQGIRGVPTLSVWNESGPKLSETFTVRLTRV